jgi:hypothetical protein
MKFPPKLLGCLFGLLSCFPLLATAHDPGVSKVTLEVDGGTVLADLLLAAADVERALGVSLRPEGLRKVDEAHLRKILNPLLDYLRRHVAVRQADGSPCALEHEEPQPEDDGIWISLRWSCNAPEGGLLYHNTLFLEINPQALQVGLLLRGDDLSQVLLNRETPELKLTEPPPPRSVLIRQYVFSGTGHIFIGYDHIAFLIALLLWATRLWPVVKIVTGFTVAHSLTLSCAVLGWFRIPGEVIEPLIAATIMYAALENFFSSDIHRRWLTAFLLGLLHGFGFAGVLQAYGLPEGELATALISFNVGVELGQVAIILLAMPLLRGVDWLLTRKAGAVTRRRELVWSLSGVVLLLGGYWLVERLWLT